jgi:hypothetical protein
MAEQCLLSGAKRTWLKDAVMSACDPKRTSAQEADAPFGYLRSVLNTSRGTSIQNDSGLSQGLVSQSVAG